MVKKRSGKELRELFLHYFEEKGHTRITSSPLVPYDDPSLLFTNAGMVQFKRVFLGEEKRSYTRATSCQKCLRVGGKHNDLENVGHTARHHTFFEMLGNFSFGDYFKRDAIIFAWEFLTEIIGLEKDKLYITIHEKDDEAFEIWEREIGISPERIYRMGDKDNFWAMGETGPCGPCSEIIYDQGKDFPCPPGENYVGGNCDRYLELWNLVFMQYNRDEKGNLSPLPRPSIDTGMGLERLAAVVQGVRNNFDTDLFYRIISKIEELTGTAYEENDESDIAIRVIADHSRSVSFLIADGILPSNEGRGYVLRRIIRRALRYARKLGMKKPFFYQVCEEVVRDYEDIYPELKKAASLITQVVKGEEERFGETLEKGLKLFEEEMVILKNSNSTIIPGDFAFKLYDTYGFPLDLTQLIARENGFDVNIKGFNLEMKKQRERAKKAWKGSKEADERNIYASVMNETGATEFVGYTTLKAEGIIKYLIRDGRAVKEVKKGEEFEMITSVTPFYGESGGQVGDTGILKNESADGVVLDTQKPILGLIVHKAKLKHGTLNKGDTILLEVNEQRRRNIMANHTATHLLHRALKNILGEHVNQSGSLVGPDYLRFDFTHFSAIKPEELRAVEEEVNGKIFEAIPVKVDVMQYQEAVSSGAVALFEEKYGETVRVISVGDYSRELCGGTHVSNTSHIGIFKIISESAVAAGIRRIEAVTRGGAYRYFATLHEDVRELSHILNVSEKELKNRAKKLLEKINQQEKEIELLQSKILSLQLEGPSSSPLEEEINKIKFAARRIDSSSDKELKSALDKMRAKIGSGIVTVGGNVKGKGVIFIAVGKDLIKKFNAGELVREIVPLLGGRGGGSPTFAQGGGKDPDKIEDAFQKLREIIKEKSS